MVAEQRVVAGAKPRIIVTRTSDRVCVKVIKADIEKRKTAKGEGARELFIILICCVSAGYAEAHPRLIL